MALASGSAQGSHVESRGPRSPGGRFYSDQPSKPVLAVDLDFDFGGAKQVCVGVLVGKAPFPNDPQLCAVAFLTAGHCTKMRDQEFSSVTVGLAASGLGDNFGMSNAKDRLAYRQDSLPLEVVAPGVRTKTIEPAFDSALVRGSVACAQVARLPVAKLALGEKPEIGNELSILRRHEPVSLPGVGEVNPGGGQAVRGTLARGDGHYLWKIENLENGGIYGGDSGGPVLDGHGHVIAVLSRGRAGGKGSDFALVDSTVADWADNILTDWGFTAERRPSHSEALSSSTKALF